MEKRCKCGNRFVTNNNKVTKCCICRGLGKPLTRIKWDKVLWPLDTPLLVWVFGALLILLVIGGWLGWY